MNRIVSLLLIFLLSSCAAIPLSKTLSLEHSPRLGIIEFKVTAPVEHLSTIATTPRDFAATNEAILIKKTLEQVEIKATTFFVEALKKGKTIEPVIIPQGVYGIHRGEKPTKSQLDFLRKEFKVDAVLYGKIPWYGKTRLIYPILGESIDITAESVAIGLAVSWNPAIIFANIGFEVLTSTPLWFGGYYFLGYVFRPVTVEVWVLTTTEGKEIWHKSEDEFIARSILKSYPESDRSKKEIQFEASLRKAIEGLANSLSK